MKKFVFSLAFALSAQAWAASITSFTPQNLSETTNQIRVSFSDKMVALGVEPDPKIFSVACQPAQKGVPRWEDEKSWSYNFETKLYANKLPGGTRCTVTLDENFKKQKKITGKTAFAFQVDGPNIISIYPGEPDGRSMAEVAEDQVFAIGLDAEADEASVLKNLKFKVEGIASPVQVRVLSEAEKRVLMASSGFPSWKFEKGMPLLMVQAKERFAAGKKVSLVWGAGIASRESGLARQRDLILPYAARSLFTAKFECSRENANANCSPFADMTVSFSAPVPADQLKQIELVSLDGKTRIKAVIEGSDKGESTLTSVKFPATVKEKQSFQLVLPKGMRDDAGRPLSNEAAFPLTVKTAEFPPLAKFAADFGLIEANQSPVLLPATLRNLEAQVIGAKFAPTSVEGSSVRIGAGNFPAVIEWLKKLEAKTSAARSLEQRDRSIFAGSKSKPAAFKLPLKEKGKAFEVVGIPLAGPGFYIVELQSRLLGRSLLGKDSNMYVPTGALVTNMVVHSKWGVENSLFWVTSLDSGEPVSGAQVAVFDCTGKAVWSGQTDGQGRALYNGDLKGKVNLQACSDKQAGESYSKYDGGFFVTAQAGQDFTFTHTSWNEGIETWRFEGLDTSSPEWTTSNVIATTVLDRTLVRAGESKPIGMKHFLRVPTAKGFKALNAAQLPTSVVIQHTDTGAEYTAELKWNADGTAVSSFAVPKDAKLGLYQISLTNGGESVFATSTFQVLEFKIPLMKGTIAFPPQKDQLVQPGKLDAQVSVAYQDGGPAINQPVTFRYSLAREGWYTFEDLGYGFNFGLEKVVEKESRADQYEEQTVKTVELPLRLNAKGSQVVTIPNLNGFDSPRTLTTQLEFTDANSESQNVTRTMTIFPAKTLVAVSAENSYGSDKNVRFRAAVVDLKGKPVAGVQPKLEMFENITYTHRTRMVGGYYASESFTSIKRVKDASAFKCDGVTNKKGIVSCEVVAPESGNYIIQAAVTDADGNTAYGSDSVYVRGSKRAWFPAEPNDRMDLIAEKKDLQAGETAKLQVQMPFQEATVLVTVEREGVLDSFTTKVSTTNPVINVPIKPEYAPNVFVSAVAVRGRVKGSGMEETATVDLGKPAYKLGLANLNVNWKPNALKVDVKPSKEVYKPRETASVDVTVVNADGGPAANAEFAIAVVDEGLLQLSKNRTWDLLRSMMGKRALSVETATAQMQVIGKRHYGMKAKPTGGDGGQAPTRELFDPLVYWQARVKTDANGKATVKFPMNDSLTAFRVVAVAHNGLSRFGTGESKIVAQQEVQVIPSLGTVARNGDKLATEFTVRNTTKAAKAVSVSGRVKFTYADGRVEYKTLTDKQVNLAAQGQELISLGDVEVPDGVVKAEYELSVQDANKQIVDKINVAQEIKPAILPRTWMAQLSRVTPDLQPVSVNLPSNALRDQGGVRVSLKRSLADGLDTVNSYYEAYPYVSLEYVASKAVALASKAEWEKAMQKLPAHLDAEGLIMYYPGSSSAQGSEVLTAYILSLSNDASLMYGAGFEIPAESLNKMIDGLTAYVQGRSRGARNAGTAIDTYIRRLNVIEVLVRYGKADAAWLTSLPAVAAQQIPTATLIDTLSIYSRLKTADRQAKLAEVSQAINNRLTRTGTGERIQERAVRPWYAMTSQDFDQLQLILTLSSDSGLRGAWSQHIPLLVSEAVLMMKRGAWDLTTANATGVLAMKAYTKFFEPENVTGETKVAVDFVAKNCSQTDKGCQFFKWEEQGKQAGGVLNFGWTGVGDHKVDLAHQGTGLPWAIVAVNAAVPVTKPVGNIPVVKTVEPMKSVYNKGDVVTVTLEIKPSADIPFVSIMDPIPAGAKIQGTGLDNDANNGPETSGWNWPDFQELGYDSYRASYSSISPGGVKVVYKLRLNNAGTFKLPPTRVEAVYMPENFAEVPNMDWTVQP